MHAFGNYGSHRECTVVEMTYVQHIFLLDALSMSKVHQDLVSSSSFDFLHYFCSVPRSSESEIYYFPTVHCGVNLATLNGPILPPAYLKVGNGTGQDEGVLKVKPGEA